MYLGVEVKKRIKRMSYERLDRRKRRPAKLSEKTHPLKALSSVAHFLRNGAFILINDTEGDPLNLVFVGSKDQVTHSFQQAGWLIPDPITLQTSEKIAVDSLTHKSYPTAPVSNLYVFGRVQDLAFEKPTNDQGVSQMLRRTYLDCKSQLW